MRSDIIKMACDHYNTTPAQMKSKARFAIYKAFRERGASYGQIGRWMLRDHSTIMYGVRQADVYMQDATYRDLVERMINYQVQVDVEEVSGGLKPQGGLSPRRRAGRKDKALGDGDTGQECSDQAAEA